MVYTLKWHVAETGDGKSAMKYMRPITNTYTSLDKARAAARRHLQFGVGFYMIAIHRDGSLQGYAVFDFDYAYGRSSGIFWVPKGMDHDGYYARGVSTDGSLNRKLYRLT